MIGIPVRIRQQIFIETSLCTTARTTRYSRNTSQLVVSTEAWNPRNRVTCIHMNNLECHCHIRMLKTRSRRRSAYRAFEPLKSKDHRNRRMWMIHGFSVSLKILIGNKKPAHCPMWSLTTNNITRTRTCLPKEGKLNHDVNTEQVDIPTLGGYKGYFYIRSQATMGLQINGSRIIRFGEDHPVKENHIQGRQHHDEKALRDYNILSSYAGSIHRYSAKRALSCEIIIWDRSTAPGTLVVIDDMQATHSDIVSEWFTRKSHHLDSSVIYLVQNVFDKSLHHRTINLNATHIVLFKNPRDGSQVTHLDKQVFPGGGGLLTAAYRDITQNIPHSYVVADFNQATPDSLRIRNTIFPHDDFPNAFAYVANTE